VTKLLLVVGASLSISFLCSVLEAVLLSINHSFVAILNDRKDPAGKILEEMKKKIDEPIAAILTLNTIAHTMGATMSGALAAQVFGGVWVGVFSAVLTLAILVLSEIIPKTLGATMWKQLARPTAYVLRAMVITMKPVLVPLGWLSHWITPRGGTSVTVSRAELEVLAEIGRREGTIDKQEWQVMTNIMGLDKITVGEVMTPRIDIVAVPISASVSEAMDIMLDEGKLRIPVYGESIDKIEAILLARDLWRAARDGLDSVRDIARPVTFSPASKMVEELIPEMRANRTKMVIVLDEFGGTAGLVTLEDLIEEIIGEIHDEHEIDEPKEFQSIDGGRTLLWGGTPLRDVAEHLNITLGEEFDTLGGLVFGALNRVGRVGDIVTHHEGQFRIVKMRGRRIEYVIFNPDPV